MTSFLENLGLDAFRKSEETVANLFLRVANEGTPIVGYSGNLYVERRFGDAKIIIREFVHDATGCIEIMGADTHCVGHCIWHCRLACADPQPKDADQLERRCMLQTLDGTGMAIVNLIHGDILPSFLPDDEIRLQMIGFPESIRYFADEDGYVESVPAGRGGHKMLPSPGSIFSASFLHNHDCNVPEAERDYTTDDYVLVCGVVESITGGTSMPDEEPVENAFIKCVIRTSFGPLELVHHIELVPKNLLCNLHPGAFVSTVCVLAGDVAIGPYATGIVLDAEHDLRLLRYAYATATAERVRLALAEDCTYGPHRGKEAVAAALQALCAHGEQKHFAFMARLRDFDGDEAQRLPDFPEGGRCVILAAGAETSYWNILCIKTDAEGKISRIVATADSRYHFRLDEAPAAPDDGLEKCYPESATETMLIRASTLLGIIDRRDGASTDCPRHDEFLGRAEEMLDALSGYPEGEQAAGLKNIFGYLFAKEYEVWWNDHHPFRFFPRPVIYLPHNAIANMLNTALPDKAYAKARGEMDLGKSFYSDFAGFAQRVCLTGERYTAELLQCLILVQRLGELSAPLVG